MFFNQEEIFNRIFRTSHKRGYHGPIALHNQTRCGLENFMAVGPRGVSWFDIRVTDGVREELKNAIRQACKTLVIYFEET